MSLDLAIAIIVVLDVALLAGLAFVMSRPHKLTPHQLARGVAEDLERGEAALAARLRGRRVGISDGP